MIATGLIPYTRQPPTRSVIVDKRHPIGGCLDYVWLGGDLSGVSLTNGLNVPFASGATRSSTRFGMEATAWTGSSGTDYAIPKITGYPFVVVGVGYFNNQVSTWHFGNLRNSSGGYNGGIFVNSSSSAALVLRYGGTQRSAVVTFPSGILNGAVCLYGIGQVFSETDYRFYCNGMQANGNLSPGTFSEYNRFTQPYINGGTFMLGFGSGKTIDDKTALKLSSNPQEFWRMFSYKKQFYFNQNTISPPASENHRFFFMF